MRHPIHTTQWCQIDARTDQNANNRFLVSIYAFVPLFIYLGCAYQHVNEARTFYAICECVCSKSYCSFDQLLFRHCKPSSFGYSLPKKGTQLNRSTIHKQSAIRQMHVQLSMLQLQHQLYFDQNTVSSAPISISILFSKYVYGYGFGLMFAFRIYGKCLFDLHVWNQDQISAYISMHFEGLVGK